ncbi:MAG: hypothetical protein ACYDBH_12290 [Acidobacteriaceae bacterium]
MDLQILHEHPYLVGGGLLAVFAVVYFMSGKSSTASSGASSLAAQSSAVNAANQNLSNLQNSLALSQSLSQTNALGALFGNVLASRANANTINTRTSLNMASSNTNAILSDISARRSAIIAEQQALVGA